MAPIISQPGVPAHVHPDEAAYLSMIDPLMFEIAMDAADLAVGAAPQPRPRNRPIATPEKDKQPREAQQCPAV